MNRLIPYYRARYFSPQIGRFISRDPLPKAELRQGPNLYWYVQNNPANKTDPLGLLTCDEIKQAMKDATTAIAIRYSELGALEVGDMATYKSYVARSNIIGTAGMQLGISSPADGFEISPTGLAIAIPEDLDLAIDFMPALLTGNDLTLLKDYVSNELYREMADYDWLAAQWNQQHCGDTAASNCPPNGTT